MLRTSMPRMFDCIHRLALYRILEQRGLPTEMINSIWSSVREQRQCRCKHEAAGDLSAVGKSIAIVVCNHDRLNN